LEINSDSGYRELEKEDLYIEIIALLKYKISHLEQELERRAMHSPESINAVQQQMHYYRRECDSISAKLKEAEAHIEQQDDLIDSKENIIKDLTRRCKELEDKQLGLAQ
jgi:chromosome segregation ATPase